MKNAVSIILLLVFAFFLSTPKFSVITPKELSTGQVVGVNGASAMGERVFLRDNGRENRPTGLQSGTNAVAPLIPITLFGVIKEKLVYDYGPCPLTGSCTPARKMQTEPAVAINPAKSGPNYNIIVGYNNGTRTSQCCGVGISVSTDGGNTWTSGPIRSTGLAGSMCCDPGIAFQSNGTAYAIAETIGVSAGLEVFVTRSNPDVSGNAGGTWLVPVIVNSTAGNDRPAIAIDNIVNRNPLTTPTEYIYVAWQNAGCEYISRSTNSGGSWSSTKKLCTVSGATTGFRNDLAMGPNGEVYAAWQGTSGKEVICKLSSPSSWPAFTCANPAILAFTAFPTRSCTLGGTRPAIPNTCLRTNAQPKITVDRSNNVYMVWQTFGPGTTAAAGDGDIVMSKATGGDITTWTTPVQINNDSSLGTNDGKDQFFPDIASDPASGELLSIFYDRRDIADRKNFNFYWARSTDSGASIAANGRITSVPSDPRVTNSTGFMGDYIGGDVVAAPGASRLWAAVWTDLRDGTVLPANLNSNIYFALIGQYTVNICVPSSLCNPFPWQLGPFRLIGPISPSNQSFSFASSIPVNGFNTSDTVSLSLSGVPIGAVASLSPAVGVPPFTSTLQVASQSGLKAGNYSITIVANDNVGRNSTALMTFTVTQGPALVVSQMFANPGQKLTFNGVGFKPISTVRLTLDQKFLANATSDSQGRISGGFAVPLTKDGSHLISALDTFGDSATTIFVTPIPAMPDDGTELRGDINGDCHVNIIDLATVGIAFGTIATSQEWNPAADLNNDWRIDIIDLVLIASNFGTSCG